MRTTVRDVAERAGVSAMAVSSVLNGAGRNVTVSHEKAGRIRRAARGLRYQPNHVALVFQHFGRLGPEHSYHSQVLNGVMETLFSQDYTLSLCPRRNKEEGANLIADGRYDGILWCRPDFTEASVETIQQAGVPVVMMHVPSGMISGVPTFCADNDGAMRRVVEHLKGLGHERLAFVIDPCSVKSVEGQARVQSLVAVARRMSLPEPDVVVLHSDPRVLARYAAADAPHTALVCPSDHLPGFVLASCERLGVAVPRDVSVVGFDSSRFCETTRPRLTSVSQPVEQIAFTATTHLSSLIHEAEDGLPKSPTIASVYDCGLDVRESTSPPRTH